MKKCFKIALMIGLLLCFTCCLTGCGGADYDQNDIAAIHQLIDEHGWDIPKDDVKAWDFVTAWSNDNPRRVESIALAKEQPVKGTLDVSAFTGLKFLWCVDNTMEEVILPESLKEIAFSALEGCANLKEVIFPNAPLKVQPRAFADCSSLKRAVVPDTVMLVPNDAVWNWDMDEDRPLERALNYDIFENCPEVVICGVPGSGAEEYARMAKLPFEAIG